MTVTLLAGNGPFTKVILLCLYPGWWLTASTGVYLFREPKNGHFLTQKVFKKVTLFWFKKYSKKGHFFNPFGTVFHDQICFWFQSSRENVQNDWFLMIFVGNTLCFSDFVTHLCVYFESWASWIRKLLFKNSVFEFETTKCVLLCDAKMALRKS